MPTRAAGRRGGPHLAERPATWRYGFELCQRLDLAADTPYPVLMRPADQGLLETAWENEVPAGHPPRHRYRLSGTGRALAGRLAAEAPRWYRQVGGLVLDGAGPLGVGANLGDAVWWTLTLLVLWALPLGVLGATAGRWRAHRPSASEP